MADEETARKERLVRMQQGFADVVPHNRALDMRFIDFGEGSVRLLLPYQAHLVGNPDTKVLHGGAISALLDASCGAAVYIKLRGPAAIATLDLRIDYLKPATPPEDVVCDAQCFKVTKNVAFVRALAFHDDENDPIAAAAGSFIIFEKGKSARERG